MGLNIQRQSILYNMITSNDNSKYCSKCGKWLDEACYTYKFKQCDYCIDKIRAYRKSNEEYITEWNKQHYEAN